jgi:hypothetical protein
MVTSQIEATKTILSYNTLELKLQPQLPITERRLLGSSRQASAFDMVL